VVDHQVASMLFENGVSVSFTVSAFSNACERTMKIMGTNGEIIVSTANNEIIVNEFGPGMRTGNTNTVKIARSRFGHNGGDEGIMENLAAVLKGHIVNENMFEQSVHSHMIAFAAEHARLTGHTVDVAEYEKGLFSL
jgi:predicted dehydrogenase